MAQISADLAVELFREYGRWFGSPVLLSTEPALVSEPSREFILDGLARFRAMQSIPLVLTQWRAGKVPHYIFRACNQRSEGSLKLLPRLLVLSGHHERAYQHTPEQWRQSMLDIRAYLGIPSKEAFAVFAQRMRVRKTFTRSMGRHDYDMANRSIVREVKRLFITADETGETIDGSEIRRVVFNGTTDRHRGTHEPNSLYNEPNPVLDDS